MSWMLNEPKFIVWLPTMYRLAASETGKKSKCAVSHYYISFCDLVKHEAKCSVCKMFPIVGLRFRSLKDFSTDFCQVVVVHIRCLHNNDIMIMYRLVISVRRLPKTTKLLILYENIA